MVLCTDIFGSFCQSQAFKEVMISLTCQKNLFDIFKIATFTYINVFSNHSGIRMEMRPHKRWSVESQKLLALEPNREFQYAQST